MATIYDIAAKCGISPATVSYVLSGKGDARRISKATQEKVLDVAHALHYNRTTFVARENPTIAFYWQDENFEMVIPSVIRGINRVVASQPTPINVIIRPYSLGHICDDDSLLSDHLYDGMVLTGLSAADLDFLSQNRPKSVTVLVNRSLKGYSDVSIDSAEVGHISAEHALRVSHDVAAIFNPQSFTCMNRHGKAFLQSCQSSGIDLRDRLFYCDNNINSAYTLGLELVQKNKLHKVFFCSYDMVALGLMSALNEAGIKIGTDVQVFAASNGPTDLLARSTPPLTVVDQKMPEITERSLRMALDLIRSPAKTEQHQIVHPSMIYRKSSPAVINL